MTTIHFMVGFIGFGKTSVAKDMEKEFSAVRLTHDDCMIERFGRNPDNFKEKYKIVGEIIKNKAAKYIKEGYDVILDDGFWTHKEREACYMWAKTLTDDVVFHVLECDITEAKKRILRRTQCDDKALAIDEKMFDEFLKKYEPWGGMDAYPVVWHNAPVCSYIGNMVWVKTDRPKGSKHPKFGFESERNYGFIPYTKSGDGEELDAYILMIDKPLTDYVGRCIGVIHRLNDDDDKLIVVPKDCDLADEVIEKETAFQEKWFEHVLWRHKDDCR